MSAHSVLGWGYEGRSVDDLVAFMRMAKASVLVDVRLNPISRRRGFSKRALAEALDAAGVRYLHWPSLGNPRDNRDGFSSPESPEAAVAHERFRSEVLQSEAGAEATRALAMAAEVGPLVLLCFEAEQACCHRSLVIEEVERAASPVY